MTSPERVRQRRFTLLLILCVVVSVIVQFRTGSSYAELILLIPLAGALAWIVFAVVRARRARRLSGAPRPPRVKWPISYLLATGVVLVGAITMLALTLSHKDVALEQRDGGIMKAAEAAILVLALMLPKWQRSIVRRQRANDPKATEHSAALR